MKKSNIFSFIVGAVLFGGIGVVAAYNMLAKDIKYTPSDTSWNVDNVEDAIDDLYANKNKEILNKFTLKVRAESYSSTYQGVTNYNMNNMSSIKDNYQFFKITDISTENLKSYEFAGWDTKTKTIIPIQMNKEYSLDQISSFWIIVTSNSNGTMGYAIPTVEFYNK